MTIDFLKYFDGTDKTPRDVQRQGLEWIQDHVGKFDVLVVRGPVGCGKSAMTKAVQNITNAPILTPSNILIDQYVGDYPDTNSLKGRAHYECGDGLSCDDTVNVLRLPACDGCKYRECKERALSQTSTFFNPMSYYYLTRAKGWTPPRVLIVDEAHQLSSMILMMSGKRFDSEKYDFDHTVEQPEKLKLWLRAQRGKLYRLTQAYLGKGTNKRAAEIKREYDNLGYVLQGLEEDPNNYAVWVSKERKRGRPVRFLNVKPVTPPRFITRQLLEADQVILFSGTMFDHDIKELLPGKSYKVLDLPSPIPKERRPVVAAPTKFKMNWQTEPNKIAGAICDVMRDGDNTIIHVAYSLSKKLAKFFPDALINTAEDKIPMLEKFKAEGGTFLAAGCAEGLDLKGDLCRLNIIPKLLYPNINDPVVKRRMALPDGDTWYNLETLKTLIQQAGRSTRSEEDYSECFVLDPGFMWRVKKYAEHLPQSFLEAIVLRKPDGGAK